MIKPSPHILSLDSSTLQFVQDLLRQFRRAGVRVLHLVVVRWKAVVVVDQARRGGGVDFNGIATGLPVCGDNNDGSGLDAVGDLMADLFQLDVGRMFCVFKNVGTAWERVLAWEEQESGECYVAGMVDAPWDRK